MKEIVYGIVVPAATRHAVGALGAIGVAGDDVAVQAGGAIALVVTIAWSLVEKLRARRAARRAK